MSRRRLLHAACLLALVVASGLAVLGRPTPVPVADALRYMTPALNLVKHGVISRDQYRPDGTPQPTLLDGGPLVVFEQAALLLVDSHLERSFACVLTSPQGKRCTIDFLGLKLAHWVETLVFLLCLGATARLVTGRASTAWVSVFAALLCKEMYKYSGLALTEPSYLACIGLFLYAWTRAVLAARSGVLCWIGAGIAAGLTILAKPASAAVVPAAGLMLILAILVRRQSAGRAGRMALVMSVFCAATVAPWFFRNEKVAGQFVFSDTFYLETSIAERGAYNLMGWGDWGIAWIDYLPDFGDKLAASLFGRAPVERLGWGKTSYYVYGRDVLRPMARKEAAPQSGTGLLLRDYVFGRPVKHAAVTAVLLWRGLFIGHYWGMAGLLALIWFFAAAGRSWEMSVVALPAYAIAVLNAAVSVSITRYNLQLIFPGAVSLGWLIALGATRFLSPHRAPRGRSSPRSSA